MELIGDDPAAAPKPTLSKPKAKSKTKSKPGPKPKPKVKPKSKKRLATKPKDGIKIKTNTKARGKKLGINGDPGSDLDINSGIDMETGAGNYSDADDNDDDYSDDSDDSDAPDGNLGVKVDKKLPVQARKTNKIDLKKAFELRYIRGMGFTEIGKIVGANKQSVHKALKRFEAIIRDRAEIEVYRNHQADLLDGISMQLVGDLADPVKRQKASLNNTAYAFTQINNATRLLRGESTANVAHAGQFELSIGQIDKEIARLQGGKVEENIDEAEVIEREIAQLEAEVKSEGS